VGEGPTSSGVSVSPLGILAGSGVLMMVGLMGVRRWRSRRGPSKKGLKLV